MGVAGRRLCHCAPTDDRCSGDRFCRYQHSFSGKAEKQQVPTWRHRLFCCSRSNWHCSGRLVCGDAPMTLYRQKFGLAKDPFNMTPDPDLLFMTEQHREALAGVAYAILDRKGFAVLIGPAGTGKTTLVTTVLQSLKKSPVQSSVILNPALSP